MWHTNIVRQTRLDKLHMFEAPFFVAASRLQRAEEHLQYARLAGLERTIASTLRVSQKVPRDPVALNHVERYRHYCSKILWGSALLGQHKYAEAESLPLRGYECIQQQEPIMVAEEKKLRLRDAGERVVRFCKPTNQPEQAGAWREKIGMREKPADGGTIGETQPE